MKRTRAKTVEELLEQIRQVADGGNYIFRGEPRKYPKVTSSLYRIYQGKIEAEHFNIEEVEKEIVSEVRKHTDEKDDNVILEQLQHYRGKTNQIDFSTDYFVALFFACDGNYKADGRLILLNKKRVKTHKPTSPKNRVIAQKSIFVRSPEGFVEPDNKVTVPSNLKEDVLEYLNKYHNINTATIYNDIHGYISQTAIHKSAYAYFYFGFTYQNKGEIDKSIEAYTESIELNSSKAEAYNNRGGMYATKKHHDLALANFSKAIELNPGHALAYSNRGNTYNDVGKHDLAIADCNKAIELNPNFAGAYNNRGNAYRRKEKYDLAIADYTKAIELEPNFAETYSNRGNAHCNKGDYDLAISDYSKAIELNPNFTDAYFNRGNTYDDMGEYDFAIADCNKAIELNPNFAAAYNIRGIVYGKKGENNNAIVNFTKAIELYPNFAKAYFGRGVTKRDLQGDNKGAKADFQEALRLAKKQKNKPFADFIQKRIAELAEPK